MGLALSDSKTLRINVDESCLSQFIHKLSAHSTIRKASWDHLDRRHLQCKLQRSWTAVPPLHTEGVVFTE